MKEIDVEIRALIAQEIAREVHTSVAVATERMSTDFRYLRESFRELVNLRSCVEALGGRVDNLFGDDGEWSGSKLDYHFDGLHERMSERVDALSAELDQLSKRCENQAYARIDALEQRPPLQDPEPCGCEEAEALKARIAQLEARCCAGNSLIEQALEGINEHALTVLAAAMREHLEET